MIHKENANTFHIEFISKIPYTRTKNNGAVVGGDRMLRNNFINSILFCVRDVSKIQNSAAQATEVQC